MKRILTIAILLLPGLTLARSGMGVENPAMTALSGEAGLASLELNIPAAPAPMASKAGPKIAVYNGWNGHQHFIGYTGNLEAQSQLAASIKILQETGYIVLRSGIRECAGYPDEWIFFIEYIAPAGKPAEAPEKYASIFALDGTHMYDYPGERSAEDARASFVKNFKAAGYVILRSGIGLVGGTGNKWYFWVEHVRPLK